MTEYKNFDAWQLYCRELTSPQNYIDFAWYYLIAASLQRRIWRGPNHRKLYPNVYPILVGDPAVGKGLIIKIVQEFLREHKLRAGANFKSINVASPDASAEIIKETVAATNYAAAAGNPKHKLVEEPLLIPVASECITFEALTNACAKATRAIMYRRFDEKTQKIKEDVYRHASLCFCLEELSSLFHKDSLKIVNFLIAAYDCGNYTYTTKTSGVDYINDPCLNFFGGTQPSFIESGFNDKLISQGFASRAWFIYAPRNRKFSLINPPLDEAQLVARKTISDHIKKLTEICGEVHFTDEAWSWMEKWWIESNTDASYKRPNGSEKLDPYYGRKDIHLQKLAMAIHFGEDAAVNEYCAPLNKIELSTVLRAYEVLNAAEVNMHLALNFDGANELHRTGKKILAYLRRKGHATSDELLFEFFKDVKESELSEILTFLQKSNQIVLNDLVQWVPVVKKKPED